MANDFAGSFASGLVNGFVKGKQMQRQQERHELEMEELRNNKEMREKFKLADLDVSPTEAFAVPMPDGSVAMAPSAQAAQELMGSDGDPSRVSKVFLVGGQSFADKDAAQQAADQFNSAPARMRRQADIAREYGRPDIATSLMQSYMAETNANREMVFDTFNRYAATGNLDGIAKMYSDQVGGSMSLQANADGSITVINNAGGNAAPGRTFANSQELYDYFGNMITAAPNNVFERSMANKRLGLEERQFEHRQDVDAQQLANAQTGLRIQADGLKLRQDEANNPKPTVGMGYDDKGQRVVVTTGARKGTDGQWETYAEKGPTLEGVLGPPARTGFDGIMGQYGLGGGGEQPLTVDWSKVPPKGLPPAGGAAPTGTAPAAQPRLKPGSSGVVTDMTPEESVRLHGDQAAPAGRGLGPVAMTTDPATGVRVPVEPWYR